MRDLLEVMLITNKSNEKNQNIHKTLINFESMKLHIDWDEAAGEAWATVYRNGTIVAIIGIEIPIIFVHFKDKLVIDNKLKDQYIIEEIIDFHECIWKLNIEEYNLKFPSVPWHAAEEAVNRNRFSTRDFWYATI
ncbi:hypothetical protein [Cohnella sp. AR92]|uniref:hypothetical protein n=1 Tax=Cohnella sp. AR92 TaxID=648716 RepID=UPI000F8C8608|nr:hypothetical protein [Cohnella sp. AR92]RUS41946.1 hypothetical protein ELR57_27550 [Cohnella sp. AR92]